MYKNRELLSAAKNGDFNTVKKLIASGADIEFEDIHRTNKPRPLDYAAEFGHEKIVQLLLDSGALVDLDHLPGEFVYGTPLHLAVKGNHLNVVKMLIKAGAYIDKLNWNKETPLHFAASNNNEAMVKFLIDSGADILCGRYESQARRFINEVKTKYQIKELSINSSITKLSQIVNRGKQNNSVPRDRRKLITPDDLNKDLQLFITENTPAAFVRLIERYCGWKYIDPLVGALLLNNNITHIVLDNCNIGDKGIISLGGLIERNNTIISLELEKNGITSKGLISFSGFLQKNKTLVSINLHNNYISDDGAVALAETIQMHPKLLYINLSSNQLCVIGCFAIMQAIKTRGFKNNIVNLHPVHGSCEGYTLSVYLRLGILDPQVVINGMRATINRLININPKNSRETEITEWLSKELLFTITRTKGWWQDLSLIGNSLEETGAAILAQIFRAIRLINLELYYQQGIPKQILSNSLELNTMLSHLCLENNRVDDDGVSALSEIIANGHKLAALNLGANLITNTGVESLITALKNNNNLKALNIHSNYISDRDVIKNLAEAWGKNGNINNERAGRIHSIDISCNHISESPEKEFSGPSGLLTQYTFFKSSGAGHRRPSKIKSHLNVTNRDWLVFLAYNPDSNHAMLFIEGLEENGQLFLERTHFGGKSSSKSAFASSASPFGWVDQEIWRPEGFGILENFCYDHYLPTLDAVKKLRDTLKVQAHSGQPKPFNLLGRFGADNCLTWAIKQLRTIGIEVTIPTVPIPNLFIGYQFNQSEFLTNEQLEVRYEQKFGTFLHGLHAVDESSLVDFEEKLDLGRLVKLRPNIA